MGMIIGFIIWSLVCIVLFGIGIWSYRSRDPVGFWTGSKPPRVKDVTKYNHAVGILWLVYAVLMETLGVPLLFLEQNSTGFVPVMLGSVAATIGLMIGYVFIERKYREQE